MNLKRPGPIYDSGEGKPPANKKDKEAKKMSAADKVCAHALSASKAGSSYCFCYTADSGVVVEISPSGGIVITLYKTDGAPAPAVSVRSDGAMAVGGGSGVGGGAGMGKGGARG
jgi:hypothetical protein